MSSAWGKLTTEERDAMVAEHVMGWSVADLRGCKTGDDRIQWFRGEDGLPEYTSDYNACREVEDRIERRGLWEKYIFALAEIVSADIADMRGVFGVALMGAFKITRATPDQRCLAALKALGAAPTVEPIIASEGWIRVLE